LIKIIIFLSYTHYFQMLKIRILRILDTILSKPKDVKRIFHIETNFTFHYYIPTSPKSRPHPMNHKAFAEKMHTYSILYVEDDAEIRHYITSFLRRYCKAVYACDSAEEGLLLYEEKHPNIIILDINLGAMSGVDMATYIRLKDKSTRLLITTAYTNKEFMLQAVELGLTRYLVKPVTNDDLVGALEKCWIELEGTRSIYLGDGCVYHRNLAHIMCQGREVSLRHKEVELLELFIAHEGEVLRYEFLEQTIWKDVPMSKDAIRSQIRNLRQKLPLDVLQNVSGLGYKLLRKTAHD